MPENFDLTAVPWLTKQAMHKCQVWKKEPKCSVLDTLGNGAKAAQEDRIRDIAEPWASQFLSIQKLVPDITGPRASLPRHWECLLCCCSGPQPELFGGCSLDSCLSNVEVPVIHGLVLSRLQEALPPQSEPGGRARIQDSPFALLQSIFTVVHLHGLKILRLLEISKRKCKWFFK